MRTIVSLLREEDGASLVEYALLIALIAAACAAAVTTLGTDVLGMYDSVVGAF